MTDEHDIQLVVQSAIRASATFSKDDVPISDYGILDGAIENAPYAIIKVANEFEIQYRTVIPEQSWQIPVQLYVAFDDWDISEMDMSNARQDLIDAVTVGGALVGLTLRAIRQGSDILPVYNTYVSENEIPEMLPIFLMQEILLDCEVF